MPKFKKSTAAILNQTFASTAAPKVSAWKGPLNDGVTQSILQRYVNCKERFRVQFIEGLSEPQSFRKAIEYGQMWHLCEEHFAREDPIDFMFFDLKQHTQKLVDIYPFDKDQIIKLYNICKTQFPIYMKHWEENDDVKNRRPLYQEKVFEVAYELPSSRNVLLRGKMDGVDWIGGHKSGYYLQENKSKGTIDEQMIENQLSFDLQSLMYLLALESFVDASEIKGVRYNVVRRPLSGGVGSIKQKEGNGRKGDWEPYEGKKGGKGWKNRINGKLIRGDKPNPGIGESDEEFYSRLGAIIEEKPDEFFYRWKVNISAKERKLFLDTCFHPMLENLVDDFEWWDHCKTKGVNHFDYLIRESDFPHHANRHFRDPYGAFNTIKRGTKHYLDDYLDTGSSVGLIRKKQFFEEL